MPHAKSKRRRLGLDPSETRITAHQALAAGSPGIPIRELAARSAAADEEVTEKPAGSFTDLDLLLDQLARPAIFELGKPQPDESHLPAERAGRCGAAHNRSLLGQQFV